MILEKILNLPKDLQNIILNFHKDFYLLELKKMNQRFNIYFGFKYNQKILNKIKNRYESPPH